MEQGAGKLLVLRFDPDPEQLREITRDPIGADAGDLDQILLRQDIDLIVDDVELLDSWAVPLYFLAGYGLHMVRQLPQREYDYLDIPEGSMRLSFRLEGEKVRVRDELRDREGVVEYAELLASWERFSGEAREYLLSEFPELQDHPDVGPWFRGEPGWKSWWWDEPHG